MRLSPRGGEARTARAGVTAWPAPGLPSRQKARCDVLRKARLPGRASWVVQGMLFPRAWAHSAEQKRLGLFRASIRQSRPVRRSGPTVRPRLSPTDRQHPLWVQHPKPWARTLESKLPGWAGAVMSTRPTRLCRAYRPAISVGLPCEEDYAVRASSGFSPRHPEARTARARMTAWVMPRLASQQEAY